MSLTVFFTHLANFLLLINIIIYIRCFNKNKALNVFIGYDEYLYLKSHYFINLDSINQTPHGKIVFGRKSDSCHCNYRCIATPFNGGSAVAVFLFLEKKNRREGIKFLLEKVSDFEVLFEAENGKELIDRIAASEEIPDIILMDLKMPILNGVETTKIIHKENPYLKIIALTSYGGKSFIINMIDVGASSYLLKNASPKNGIYTINEVYDKGFHYNEEVMKMIHENLISAKGKKIRSDLDKKLLSKRELEVL